MENNTLTTETATPTNTPRPSKSQIKTGILFLIFLIIIGTIFFIVGRPKVLSSITIPPVDTAGWKTYTDTIAGFTFKYPPSVTLDSESTSASKLTLNVTRKNSSEILQNESLDKIGNILGKMSTLYVQTDECNVTFVKNLTFYSGQYSIVLTVTGEKDEIISDMPRFFQTNTPKCGSLTVWKIKEIGQFDKTLLNKQGFGMAQEWYDALSGIANTIQFISPPPVAI